MRNVSWVITKWCGYITDSGRDEKVMSKPKDMPYKFRLKDDDGEIYAYGYAKSREIFAPLDWAMPLYGCVAIEYYENKKWEIL